jgi:hypothetical protein
MALHNYKIQAGLVNLSKAVHRSQFRCLGASFNTVHHSGFFHGLMPAKSTARL